MLCIVQNVLMFCKLKFLNEFSYSNLPLVPIILHILATVCLSASLRKCVPILDWPVRTFNMQPWAHQDMGEQH